MTPKPYKTLMTRGAKEFIINKSRFIGYGAPCETEEQALAFLAEIRQKHKDASHNCYAYIIGTNMGIMRYSDDGEPSGTAGMPIIEVMKARQVTNCAVVVTRYFGGVLLGAGGLVRAYSQGSASALDASGVGVMHPTKRIMAGVDYGMLGVIEHFLKSECVVVEEKEFTVSVTLTMRIKSCDYEGFCERLLSVSEGQCEPIEIDEIFMPWAEENACNIPNNDV